MPIVQIARDRKLFSLSGLAREYGMAWRTVARRMEGVEPDGEVNGTPGWYAATAARVLVAPGAIPAKGGDPDLLPPMDRLSFWRSERERLRVELENGTLLTRIEVEQQLARVSELVGRFYDTLPDVMERDGLLSPSDLARLETALDGNREELYRALVDPKEDEAADA